MELNENEIALFQAVKEANFNRVQLFLLSEEEIDVNKTDNDGKTALHHATSGGNLEIVKFLLDRGVDVNKADNYGRTALQFAARSCNHGRDEIVKLLLKHPKIDVNKAPKYGETALHCATQGVDNYEIVELLLKHKDIDVNKANNNGNTPLLDAIRRDHNEIVELLLKHPKIDVNKDKSNNNAETALLVAIQCGKDGMVKLLLNHKDIDVNKAIKGGETPLHSAARCGQNEFVKLLLNHKDIDVNQADEIGRTALYWSVNCGKDGIVKLLLNHKDIDVNQADKGGQTALLGAARYGKHEIVKLLLDHQNIDVNQADRFADTPLLLALRYGKHEIVKLLLDHQNIDVNQADRFADTPLLLALRNNHEIVRLLIKSGKCDLAGMEQKLLDAFVEDPGMIIKISQQKPGIFNKYVDQIETIAQENNFPVLSLYGKGVQLMEYRNYNKEPLEFIKQCNHIARSLKSYNCPILEVLISSYDIMKFLDQKDVIKFLFISKTTYVCLGVYQISFKNFDTITLTLKNGNAQPPFKDYVWDAEQNSFNYSNSNGNQQIEFRNNIDNEYIVDKTDNIHFAGDINSADDF